MRIPLSIAHTQNNTESPRFAPAPRRLPFFITNGRVTRHRLLSENASECRSDRRATCVSVLKDNSEPAASDFQRSLTNVVLRRKVGIGSPSGSEPSEDRAQNQAKSLFRNILKINPLRSRFWRRDHS